ncbi:MAG: ETC complex I subunit [Micavibrio sp.]
MKVRIFQPSKNAMQSGRGNTDRWVLEYEVETKRQPEPLMGWTASGDTLNQVSLKFKSAEDAVAYAQEKGWDYTVSASHGRKIVPRNYSDNFRYLPPEEKSG